MGEQSGESKEEEAMDVSR